MTPSDSSDAQPQPRLFELVRHHDVTGFSGVGVVADGVEFPDGAVSFQWRGEYPSTCVYEMGIEAVLAVHGHNGATEIRWIEYGNACRPVAPDEAGRLGTAWNRHDDPHWPPPIEP